MTDAERLAHLTDDYEKLRTHSIRTINNVDPLLTNALSALEAGDLHVVRRGKGMAPLQNPVVIQRTGLCQCGNVL